MKRNDPLIAVNKSNLVKVLTVLESDIKISDNNKEGQENKIGGSSVDLCTNVNSEIQAIVNDTVQTEESTDNDEVLSCDEEEFVSPPGFFP